VLKARNNCTESAQFVRKHCISRYYRCFIRYSKRRGGWSWSLERSEKTILNRNFPYSFRCSYPGTFRI